MTASVKLGIVGTGFISRHLVSELDRYPDYELTRVLTRRPIDTCGDYPQSAALTNDIDDFVSQVDLLVECSGDPIWATEVIDAAVSSGHPVVTMNAEFHVTTGSYFVGRGLITEAEGDQPGCQASLREEIVELGFLPIVYGNMKGFLNRTPTPDEMSYWSTRQGISMPMVTASTDGTKVQIEQALVANGLDATIATQGLLGPETDNLPKEAAALGAHSEELGMPIADYVLSPDLPHGVFIVARHATTPSEVLRYYKLGDGPFYTLVRNNIFVHLEIMKTVERVRHDGAPLLDNSSHPTISVATIAKRDLEPGTSISVGIGSFDVRGEAIRIADHPEHVPIGLMSNVVIARPVESGQHIEFADVEVPESLALRVWGDIVGRVQSR